VFKKLQAPKSENISVQKVTGIRREEYMKHLRNEMEASKEYETKLNRAFLKKDMVYGMSTLANSIIILSTYIVSCYSLLKHFKPKNDVEFLIILFTPAIIMGKTWGKIQEHLSYWVNDIFIGGFNRNCEKYIERRADNEIEKPS
jgi:hypothetical protein